MKSNYYISSFFWSAVGKLLTAVINFISVPLLIGVWGQAEYGILALALACNGYMSLIDFGINTGAVRYFSIWISDNKMDKLHRVANSNTVFYLGVAVLNCAIMLLMAFCGESWFNISHDQFEVLRSCLILLAIFCFPTWATSTFNQLLIADKEMAYTQKVYCLITLLKGALIGITIWLSLKMTLYYGLLLAIVASTLVPYMVRCVKKGLCGRFEFKFYWEDFKPVLNYSLAIFALSIFQVSATQTRPIILGIFADNAADVLAEYQIISVIPTFIIAIGGMVSGILLPRSSEFIASGNKEGVERFAYSGTKITSILSCVLTLPFIVGGKEILTAYVGAQYLDLTLWLIIWCATVLLQIHTTPGNSLILALGKTKPLVWTSAAACLLSMVINAVLSKQIGVGSAVIGYAVYVVIVIGSYYVIYYKRLLKLSRLKILKSFMIPAILGLITSFPVICLCDWLMPYDSSADRWMELLTFTVKSLIWLAVYVAAIFGCGLLKIRNSKIVY